MTVQSDRPPYGPQAAFQALIRHRGKCLGVLILGMTVTIAAILLSRRQYQSEAKLRILIGRESVTLDPSATTGQTVSIHESRHSEINSILESISSRSMVGSVVDRVGIKRIVGDAGPGWMARLGLVPRLSAREKAIEAVARSTDIVSPRDSSVIVIHCRAGSPELARELADAYVEIYSSEHIRTHRTTGSYEFFVAETENVKERLRMATQKLNQRKTALNITSISDRRNLIAVKMRDNQTAELQAEADYSAAQAKAKKLNSLIAELPERMETQTTSGHPNNATDYMRQQLYELEILAKEIATKTTKSHPRFQAIQDQLAQAKKIFEQSKAHRSQSTMSVNPIRRALQDDLLEAEANLASLSARQKLLEFQRGEIQLELAELHNHELEVARLESDVTLATRAFDTYAQKLAQATMHHHLENEGISNINVMQSAMVAEKPVSPNTKLALMLGVAMSFAGVFLVAVIADWRSPSPPQNEQQPTRLGLSVVSSSTDTGSEAATLPR